MASTVANGVKDAVSSLLNGGDKAAAATNGVQDHSKVQHFIGEYAVIGISQPHHYTATSSVQHR